MDGEPRADDACKACIVSSKTGRKHSAATQKCGIQIGVYTPAQLMSIMADEKKSKEVWEMELWEVNSERGESVQGPGRAIESPVTKEILRRNEMRLKKLLDHGDRLENLIIYAASSGVNTTRIRKQLLDVTAKIKELECHIGLDKIADMHEQTKRLID